MPIGVETFLQPALQPVFDLIISEGAELFRRLTGSELKVILKIWKSELKMINGLRDDAMNMRIKSKAVQIRIEELRDLELDMEDILADFEFEAQKHEFNINTADQQDDDEEDGVAQGVINAVNNMVAKFSDTVSTSMSTLTTTISPDIQSKITDIKTRLELLQPFELVKLTNKHKQQTLQTEALRSERETSALQLESNVYGRDEGKQKIITRLLNDDGVPSNETYVVIPIVGCGGIGKTTLAQWVYNDEKVKGHFDLMAWVCVSDVFDVKRITITIVNEATTSGTLTELSSLNAAQTQLMQILMDKKFLILLDDVWNCTNHGWQRLKTPFKHAAKGSRVIMTTRNEGDAMTMIKCPTRDTIIRLKGLSEDECWNLFQQHANNDSDLAEMRDDIVKKCKGLPLAAKALGGLFKKIVDKSQRRMILESNVWSEDNIWSKDIDILPVLRLSYDYLPSHLKRVFAYCSLFPKDRQFGKMEVILLWMAQGFLPNDEHMEDVGHKYFNDLQSRSLLEQSPNPFDKGMFVMHDLIHDLALWAAGGICYARGTKNMRQVERQRIRHVLLTRDEDATSLLSQLKASHLRTFYDGTHGMGIMDLHWDLDFIQSFSYVRTLRLESETIEVLPEYIGELKHLRFLSLVFKSIRKLPESINCLWNLQTLELNRCRNLKKVPYIGSLEKLRHLEIDLRIVELPRGIEKLKNLRSLEYFKLADGDGSRIKKLKNLNHLQGQLTICGLGNVSKVEDAKKAQLYEKSGLDELNLQWGTCKEQVDNNIVRDVVEELKPATSIKECTLDGYMGLMLPSWLGDPSFNNIVTIKLLSCEKCEELPPLGQLPCLKRLDISGMDGLKRLGSNPFPCLESLTIGYCKLLEGDLPPDNLSLTKLQSLEIVNCPKLQCFPGRELPENLKRLDICGKINAEMQEWGLHRLHSLEFLNLQYVNTEEDLDLSLSSSSLRDVYISGIHNLKNLSIVDGTNLNELKIRNCKKLESLVVGNSTSLSTLRLESCPKLQSLPPLSPTFISELELYDLGSSTDAIEQIPGPNLDLPSSLRKLRIEGFQNLKTITCSTLPNLEKLIIIRCPKFESFGDTALHSNLKRVDIDECELIKPHLQIDPHNGVIRMDDGRYSLC